MNTEVNAMDLNYLFKDRPAGDPLGKTEDPAVLVMGGRGKLHMMLNGIADGEKHPVMLLLHGFPGNEKNLDLAQAFRRIGFNVFTFNYSGAWGSAGPFSFANGIEDVRTVIEYIRSCDTVGSCRLDNDNLFLCGHSMSVYPHAVFGFKHKIFLILHERDTVVQCLQILFGFHFIIKSEI